MWDMRSRYRGKWLSAIFQHPWSSFVREWRLATGRRYKAKETTVAMIVLEPGSGDIGRAGWRLATGIKKPAQRYKTISSLNMRSRNQGKNSALEHLWVFIGNWQLGTVSKEVTVAMIILGVNLSHGNGGSGMATGNWQRNLLHGHGKISGLNIQSKNQGKNSALKRLRVFIREGATGDWLGQRNLLYGHRKISSLNIQSRNQGENSALKGLRVLIREGMATGDWLTKPALRGKLSAQRSQGLHSGRRGNWRLGTGDWLGQRNRLYGHRNISSLNIHSKIQGKNSALKGLRFFIREGKATGDWGLARVTKPALWNQGENSALKGLRFFIREGKATGDWGLAIGDWLGNISSLNVQSRNQGENSALKGLRVFIRDGKATGDWRLARSKNQGENSARKHLRVFIREGMATGDWRLARESREKLSAQTSPGLHLGRRGNWRLAKIMKPILRLRKYQQLEYKLKESRENTQRSNVSRSSSWGARRLPLEHKGIKKKKKTQHSIFTRERMVTSEVLQQLDKDTKKPTVWLAERCEATCGDYCLRFGAMDPAMEKIH
ncbi:hypothetical protein JOM56_014431 [Amanita muscaria]